MKWRKGCDSPDSIREISVQSPRETVDSDEILLRCSDNDYQMSLGIHLNPKTIDISSATWPKMKRRDSNNGDVDVASIIRPQTATLERPRILDVTLIGKIDMSLTRKGLLSISNLCVAPLENLQTRKNSISNRENRHAGKTRKWHTPRRSMDDKERIKKMKNQYKRNGDNIYESWEDDENSVSDSTLSVKKVSKPNSDNRSPSRGTPVKQGPRDKRVSLVNNININTNSPARRTLQIPRDKKLSPVNSTASSPARGNKKVPREKRASSDNSSNSSNRNSSSNSSSNSTNSDENTDKPTRKSFKRPVIIKKDGKNVDEVFAGPKPGEVPEPCRTCGRPEQPERFHSHPPPSSHKQTSAMKRQQDNNNNNDDASRSAIVKSSVRKPVPIKYRSGKSNRRKSTSSETSVPSKVPSPDPQRRNSKTSVGVEEQPMDRKSPRGGVFVVLDDKPMVKPGPRTVLCYLCGREFGTASFPLHEPHCLQRWERENSKLPAHLQRSVPEKPSNPLTVEQWNAFAWEASQAHLVPCEKCARTFNPDRLEVHQRSCRANGQPTRRANMQEQDSDGGSTPVKVPPAVYCYICGKMFGTRSIGIHEPQCLDKWRLENDKLPPSQRRAEPMKPQSRVTSTSIATTHKALTAPPPPQTDPELAAAPHTMDCYLCGREFDTRMLNQHEDECIKEWRKWNRSLPPDQRRPEPERPEFKFNKATGNMDFKATMDAIWQEHLKSLMPCSKGCGRTFNPDRVEIHERGCKGPKK